MTKRKIGRGVAIVGAGMSKFGSFPEKTGRELFVEAYLDMLAAVDKGVDPKDINAFYLGNYSSDLFEGQGHNAPLLADAVGLTPLPATRVEGACASGSLALRQGIIAIASGMYDMVLVGGMEKMSNLPTSEVTDALATAGDVSYEVSAGFTFPAFYAAMASAYMHRYGMTPEHLMQVAIKNHENGALNPKAQFNVSIPDWMAGRVASAQRKGKPIPQWHSVDDFLHDDMANPMIAWPLRLFDCSPITDGAAALLLVAADMASSLSEAPIAIIGSGQASDSALHDRPDLTTLTSARLAGQQAYAMAGVRPADIKIAEVHDCFTIAEIIASEDLGFFAPGDGFKAAADGMTARLGSKPINTSGGLKAKGHPVGASGVAQVVEIWHQMRGQAGERQAPIDVDLALTHNVGGTGQTAVVHIFERG